MTRNTTKQNEKDIFFFFNHKDVYEATMPNLHEFAKIDNKNDNESSSFQLTRFLHLKKYTIVKSLIKHKILDHTEIELIHRLYAMQLDERTNIAIGLSILLLFVRYTFVRSMEEELPLHTFGNQYNWKRNIQIHRLLLK